MHHITAAVGLCLGHLRTAAVQKLDTLNMQIHIRTSIGLQLSALVREVGSQDQ